MFKNILTKDFWLCPYTLAVFGILLMFLLNNTVVSFVIIGCIYACLSEKLIDYKSLLKISLTFALIQLFITLMFIIINEFDYLLFAPGVYFKRIAGYFIMSLVLGSIIFFIVNSIIYGIKLLIKRIQLNKENKEGENI